MDGTLSTIMGKKEQKRILVIIGSLFAVFVCLHIFFYNYYDWKLCSLYVKTFRPYRKEKSVFSAIRHGDVEFLKELIKQGCDVRAKNASGATTVTFAMYSPIFNWQPRHTFTREELERIDQKTCQIVKLLVDSGADVNEFNAHRESPLYLSIQFDMYRTSQLLLNHGAKTDVLVTPNLKPLLYYALLFDANRKHSYFDLLVQHGANVNIRDNNGNTLLHLAIEDNLDVSDVRPLFEQGLDINVKNNYDETPLELAVRKRRREYVELIERHMSI